MTIQRKLDSTRPWPTHRRRRKRQRLDWSPDLQQANESVVLQRTLASPQNAQPGDILALQRMIGNQAVMRLLAQKTTGSAIQTKLALGPATDSYEREADRVAQQVSSTLIRQSVQRQDNPVTEEISTVTVGKITPEIETAIQGARNGGETLPKDVRGEMEHAFGADFSGVRVHTNHQADVFNRALQARAFTTGQDIFFRHGDYDPGSSGGQTLLAHELTHVMQQNGPAVQRKPGQSKRSGMPGVSQYLSSDRQPIQRIMSLATFQTKTTLFGEGLFKRNRNRILLVEQALNDYTAISPVADTNIAQKDARLDSLITVCNTYLTTTGTKRRSGVRKLLRQAQKDKTVIGPLAESKTAGDNYVRFKKVTQAQDAQLRLYSEGLCSLAHPLVNMDPWLMAVQLALRGDAPAMQQVLQRELRKLTKIMNDPGTPQLTRDILAEVLANTGDVNLQEGKPGTRFKKPTETFTEQYVVTHGLNAPEGTAERLGSLTHELTHVSVSETFNNTVLLLAIRSGASDQEIKDLSAERTQKLQDLEDLMEADSKFTDGQKMLLRNKIKYPAKDPFFGDLNRYATKFQAQLPGPTYTRIINLAAQGVNNSVVEYDTVINQMMVYMTLWGIPEKNKFYKELRKQAQEAYDYRANARH